MNISNQITVVIVLYNSSNLIFDCLNSLNKFSIILVDNGKNLHLLEKLQTSTKYSKAKDSDIDTYFGVIGKVHDTGDENMK